MLPTETRDGVVSALKQNYIASYVARMFQPVSLSTVCRIAKQERIILTNAISKEKTNKVIQAIQEGASTTQAAEQVGGVSRTTVYRMRLRRALSSSHAISKSQP